jgi:hypothetical protein
LSKPQPLSECDITRTRCFEFEKSESGLHNSACTHVLEGKPRYMRGFRKPQPTRGAERQAQVAAPNQYEIGSDKIIVS